MIFRGQARPSVDNPDGGSAPPPRGVIVTRCRRWDGRGAMAWKGGRNLNRDSGIQGRSLCVVGAGCACAIAGPGWPCVRPVELMLATGGGLLTPAGRTEADPAARTPAVARDSGLAAGARGQRLGRYLCRLLPVPLRVPCAAPVLPALRFSGPSCGARAVAGRTRRRETPYAGLRHVRGVGLAMSTVLSAAHAWQAQPLVNAFARRVVGQAKVSSRSP